MSTEKKYKYIIDLLLQSQGFSNNMTKVQGQLKGAETAARRTRAVLLEMAGALGFSYGIGQLTQMVAETVKLAAKAEGVKAAFEKLDRPGLLNELQRATSGTVSNLDLMTRAVQARNFKISMEALPTYFKFATNRALETGQAVDYLVESLVTGVGRRSVLWLDNLGLSVIEINEELKKTPDFAEAVGKVIEREMTSAGNVADTTATKIQSITASWENLKEKFGESILGKGGSEGMGILSDWLDMLSASNLTGGQKIGNWINTLIGGDMTQKWKENKKAAEDYFGTLDKANVMRYIITYSRQLDQLDEEGKMLLGLAVARYKEIKASEESNKGKKEEARTLETLNTDLNMYNELLLKTPLADKETIKSHLTKIKQLEEEKKAIMGLIDAKRKLVEVPGSADTSNLSIPTVDIGKVGKPRLADSENWLEKMKAITDENTEAWIKYAATVENKGKAMIEMGSDLGSIFSSIATRTDDGTAAWLNFTAMALTSIPLLITQIIALSGALAGKAIAGAVAGANDVPFPLNLIAMSASVGATLAALAVSVPKFAEGGIVSGPTIAQVGEYPGARSNPEVIAPLNKLQAMIGTGSAQPKSMRLAVDGGGNLIAFLEYKQRHLNNYR